MVFGQWYKSRTTEETGASQRNIYKDNSGCIVSQRWQSIFKKLIEDCQQADIGRRVSPFTMLVMPDPMSPSKCIMCSLSVYIWSVHAKKYG